MEGEGVVKRIVIKKTKLVLMATIRTYNLKNRLSEELFAR